MDDRARPLLILAHRIGAFFEKRGARVVEHIGARGIFLRHSSEFEFVDAYPYFCLCLALVRFFGLGVGWSKE